MGTRSTQALKIAMVACCSPTTLWAIATIGLPVALAYPCAMATEISSWQHSIGSGKLVSPKFTIES